MIELLYVSSLRCKEAGSLRIEDIDFQGGEGSTHKIRTSKGGIPRDDVYLSKELI